MGVAGGVDVVYRSMLCSRWAFGPSQAHGEVWCIRVPWQQLIAEIDLELVGATQESDKIWKVLWEDAEGRLIPTRFKWLSGHEPTWYGALGPRWGTEFGLSPLTVASTIPPYVLLPDLGPSLKQRMTTYSPEHRFRLLQTLVLQLAAMHVRFRPFSSTWAQSGLLQKYSVQASKSWMMMALHGMAGLADQGWPDARAQARATRDKLETIGPHLEAWTNQSVDLTVIHGDAHLGNWLVRRDASLALMDWEYLSVGAPARDLAVLFQDVWDPDQRQMLFELWSRALHQAGWTVAVPEFLRAYQATWFDNTIMMLAFDIQQFRQGRLGTEDLRRIWEIKLSWLDQAYEALSRCV